MSTTDTWGWYSANGTPNVTNDDLNGSYNGRVFTIGQGTTTQAYGTLKMIDGDGDGNISAVQSNQSPAPGNGDRIQTADGVDRQLYEIAIYNNSAFTYTNATGGTSTYYARAVVYQLGNGSTVIRMRDDDRNAAPTDLYIANVVGITLGTWDGTKYGGTVVSNFDEAPPN